MTNVLAITMFFVIMVLIIIVLFLLFLKNRNKSKQIRKINQQIIFEEVYTEEFTDIRIDIPVDHLNIMVSDSNETLVTIQGTSSTDLRVNIENNKLKILKDEEYNKSIIESIINVTIPKKTYNKIVLNVRRGNINITDLNSDCLIVSNCKGENNIQAKASNFILNIVGSQSNLILDVVDFHLNSVNSKVETSFISKPTNVKLSSVKDEISLNLLKDNGFTLRHQGVLADVESNISGMRILNNKYTYLNGNSQIYSSAVSGKVSINVEK